MPHHRQPLGGVGCPCWLRTCTRLPPHPFDWSHCAMGVRHFLSVGGPRLRPSVPSFPFVGVSRRGLPCARLGQPCPGRGGRSHGIEAAPSDRGLSIDTTIRWWDRTRSCTSAGAGASGMPRRVRGPGHDDSGTGDGGMDSRRPSQTARHGRNPTGVRGDRGALTLLHALAGLL
jgi:hypothetical protein